MRSPVSRISAVAILALAVGGIAVWFYGGGTTPAFADFIEPILSAKTVTFKTTFEDEGQKITGKVMAMASPQRTRSEQDRRLVLVGMSENGRKFQEAVRAGHRTTARSWLGPLSPGERELFLELMAKITRLASFRK